VAGIHGERGHDVIDEEEGNPPLAKTPDERLERAEDAVVARVGRLVELLQSLARDLGKRGLEREPLERIEEERGETVPLAKPHEPAFEIGIDAGRDPRRRAAFLLDEMSERLEDDIYSAHTGPSIPEPLFQ
jgi:hypothetical protein